MDPIRRAFDPFVDRFDIDLEDEFFVPTSRLYSSGRLRHGHPRILRPSSWTTEREAGATESQTSKELFALKLDLHQFSPEDCAVSVKDGSLIVTAKHEERQDSHGFIARQFTRRYVLPDDIKLDHLVCNMTSDGVLSVEAPRASAQPGAETRIPIRQTGRPSVVPPAPSSATNPTSVPTPSAPQSQNQSSHHQGTPKGQTIHIEREDAPASGN